MKVIVIHLDNQEYALDIQKVVSIETIKELTRIPGTPSYLKGVLNLRGHISPIIDLKEILNMGEAAKTELSRIVIVYVNGTQYGFIVDAATDVIDIHPDSVQQTNSLHVKENLDFLDGVATIENRLLLLINPDKILKEEQIEVINQQVNSK
ncbi:chemotaxis protein CheW [Radiobacillus kanasensis]|uniref:chemotaxis protein CheW n=1 Tax=Radiobacillus kanasensis TaxID=2844358 RepID=UPI001E302722|nr:chemotaxis protein CheW [Radiobacillus kanasensis]UFU01118.1 chemotaxis protein CheW [Radiobacillus kanasensis]